MVPRDVCSVEAAESLRRTVPTSGVGVLESSEGEYPGWTLEATLSDVDSVRSNVHGALLSEDLDLQLVQPRGEYYVVIATG